MFPSFCGRPHNLCHLYPVSSPRCCGMRGKKKERKTKRGNYTCCHFARYQKPSCHFTISKTKQTTFLFLPALNHRNKLSEAIESLVLPGLQSIGGVQGQAGQGATAAAAAAGLSVPLLGPGVDALVGTPGAEQGAALLLESMIGLYQMGAQQRGIQVEVPEEWRRLLRDGWEARIPTVSEWLRQRVLEFEARIPEEFLKRVEEQHEARSRIPPGDGGAKGNGN